MDVLDAGDELISQEENGLQGELAIAEIEEILQAGAEQVNDHGIVLALGAKPADEGDTNTTNKGLVGTSLAFQLRALSLDALELDGNFLAGDDVGSQVDVTEGAAPNLTTDTVFITDAKILWEICQHNALH
jgi:hypothetical protein